MSVMNGILICIFFKCKWKHNSDLLLMNFYYVTLIILSTFCNANKQDKVHLRLYSTDFTQAGLLLFYQKFTVISNKNVLNLTIKCQKHLTRTTVDLSTRNRILRCFFYSRWFGRGDFCERGKYCFLL